MAISSLRACCWIWERKLSGKPGPRVGTSGARATPATAHDVELDVALLSGMDERAAWPSLREHSHALPEDRDPTRSTTLRIPLKLALVDDAGEEERDGMSGEFRCDVGD